MKLHFLAILSSAALLPASVAAQGHWTTVTNGDYATVTGSGRIVSQPRPVGDFHAIETNGAANIHVRVGLRPSVVVTTDDNLLPYMRTEVSDGVLHVATVGSYRTRVTPQIYVTVPDLTSALTRGSGDIDVAGVDNRSLELITEGSGSVRADGRTGRLVAKIEGSGDAQLRAMQAASADVEVDGSGDAWIGSAGALVARSNGSGDLHVLGYSSDADVAVYGSGDAWIATDGGLIARAFGSGNVHVGGHPASLRVSRGGSGRVIVGR